MDPDQLERRCPRLGNDVAFGYCTSCGDTQSPCFRVLDCWWERFDVVAHMKASLTPKAFATLMSQRTPPDKVASLVALIHQAKARSAQD